MHRVQSGGRKAIPQTWVFGLELVLWFGKQRAGGARPESQPPAQRWCRLILRGPAGCWWPELGMCWHRLGGPREVGLPLTCPQCPPGSHVQHARAGASLFCRRTGRPASCVGA